MSDPVFAAWVGAVAIVVAGVVAAATTKFLNAGRDRREEEVGKRLRLLELDRAERERWQHEREREDYEREKKERAAEDEYRGWVRHIRERLRLGLREASVEHLYRAVELKEIDFAERALQEGAFEGETYGDHVELRLKR